MIEAGSFRDPESRVFYHDGRILRGLGDNSAAADAAARTAGVLDRLVTRGLFVDSWLVDDVEPPPGVPTAAVVESRRLPLVSYPSEWSFAMLRDAALATLDANLIALESGFILKDASAFNVLFEGTHPRIIDVSSIEEFGEAGIWTAYGQFCDHFLAPLMLEAYAGVNFQGVLRGQVAGLPISELSRILRGRSGLHKGVLTHVRLRSVLERRGESMDTRARTDVARAELPRSTVAATIGKTRKLVAGLESSAPSVWAKYESNVPYDTEAFGAKRRFVAEAAEAASEHDLAVDVGANAGLFTRVLAGHFGYVVGIDTDAGAVDALYAASRGLDSLTPLVIDVANPTTSFGWRGRERAAFADRVRPSFATWLAVLHHLCLGLGIPLNEVVTLIFELSPEAVVEFVAAEDSMAQRISATRTTPLAPYSLERFEHLVESAGAIKAKLEISGTRTLYHIAKV